MDELIPEEGVDYTARPVSGMQCNAIGSDGRLEYGFVATVDGFGSRLWFVVVTEDPGYFEELTVRFNPCLYFNHSREPRDGQLYGDARFYVPKPEG